MSTPLISQSEASKKSYERYNQALKSQTGLIGTDTGHHDINLATGGHMGGKITTLAARSGIGKTGTIIPMVKAAARVYNNRRSEIICFSWEMGPDYLIDRMICHDLGITLSQLRYPKILPEGIRKQINTIYNNVAKLPITYHTQSTNIETCAAVMDKFLETIHKKSQMEGVKIQPVMFLDFIGRIKDSGQYKGSKTYSIEHFLMGLKQYINHSDYAAFILAQILRSADEKEFPDVVDIKDSSSIEENSDNLILVSRPEYLGKETIKNPRTGDEMPSKDKLLMRFVKTRENQPHDVITNCDMRYFRFHSMECPAFDFDYCSEYYTQENYWESKMNL
jgi:replicative DNA helicase